MAVCWVLPVLFRNDVQSLLVTGAHETLVNDIY